MIGTAAIPRHGADWRADPSSALLEVLDPAQNHTFRDNYLDVDLDLSEVLFIPTGNVTETIPGPLLDRMEVIRLDGYTEDEKVLIARDHLLKRQLERNGLEPLEVEITDAALKVIVAEYTREAGVRNLERELGKALRKVTTKIAAGDVKPPVTIDIGDVREYLGRQRFFFEAADRTAVPGVATGLAITGTGGEVLFIEASVMEGEPGLTLTGQLGDVMKESAQIALSYVWSHSGELGIDPANLNRRFHVLEGREMPGFAGPLGSKVVCENLSALPGLRLQPSVAIVVPDFSSPATSLEGSTPPLESPRRRVLAKNPGDDHQVPRVHRAVRSLSPWLSQDQPGEGAERAT
jgi:ATP-dependent Lon protease